MQASQIVILAIGGVVVAGIAGYDDAVKYLDDKLQAAVTATLAKRGDDRSRRLDVIDTRISDAEAEIAALKQGLDGQRAYAKLAFDLLFESYSSVNNAPAIFDPDDQGYAIARTQFGPIIIGPKSIAPHLDGYKVTLSIGNPTTARFNGFKLNVKWAMPSLTSNADGSARATSQEESKPKEKEISYTEVLLPGSYTDISVPIAPAKPAEIKQLSVQITLNQMSLNTALPARK